jgi:hypothetical protein
LVSPYHGWPFLSDPARPFLSAVWAVLIHGVIGLLVVAPIVWHSRHQVRNGAIAFVGGSALDIDHFIQAGTLNLHRIETLGDRPETHSIAFVLLLSLVTFVLFRRWLAAWSMFAVNLAHLLFDASGGGEHILYPFNQVNGIPWLLCPIGTLALLGLSWMIQPRSSPTGPQRRHQDPVAASP